MRPTAGLSGSQYSLRSMICDLSPRQWSDCEVFDIKLDSAVNIYRFTQMQSAEYDR